MFNWKHISGVQGQVSIILQRRQREGRREGGGGEEEQCERGEEGQQEGEGGGERGKKSVQVVGFQGAACLPAI